MGGVDPQVDGDRGDAPVGPGDAVRLRLDLLADLVSHVRLELELGRGAEGGGEHLHEPLAVAAGVQAVHGVLDDVKAFVAGRLQVVLGRQVGPEGAVQAGVEA